MPEQDWVAGNNPDKTSYCSPWVLVTVKHDSIAGAQDYVTTAFAHEVIEQSSAYLMGDLADNIS